MSDFRNWTVALKARVDNSERIEAAIFELTQSLGQVTAQEDVFFDVPNGQLKLRTTQPNHHGQLIFHKKVTKHNTNLNESRVTEVEDAASLREILGMALGELGSIRTERRVFTKDNIVICLGSIDDIGDFVDIKVNVTSHTDEEEGIKLAKTIQAKLGIADEHLVPLSYFDLLTQDEDTEPILDIELSLTNPKAIAASTDESDQQSLSSDSASY